MQIDMDALEQAHGNDVSENGELQVAEEWALNKAFYTELLGFPLILWDRRILLKPSPYKRVDPSPKLQTWHFPPPKPHIFAFLFLDIRTSTHTVIHDFLAHLHIAYAMLTSLDIQAYPHAGSGPSSKGAPSKNVIHRKEKAPGMRWHVQRNID